MVEVSAGDGADDAAAGGAVDAAPGAAARTGVSSSSLDEPSSNQSPKACIHWLFKNSTGQREKGEAV